MLFLGSKEKYKQYFDEMSGAAFWYTPGWIENCSMPCEDTRKKQLKAYAEKYGEENAEFLLDMENTWYNGYEYTAYIKPENKNYPDYAEFSKSAADYYGWKYKEFAGDNRLLRMMLNGDWDESEFLVVPPKMTALPSVDENVIRVGRQSEIEEFLNTQSKQDNR